MENMSEGTAVRTIKRNATRSCRHHWIIETPHGATSRGLCKRCGARKRFPNAPEEKLWGSGGKGRWSSTGGVARVSELRRNEAIEDVDA